MSIHIKTLAINGQTIDASTHYTRKVFSEVNNYISELEEAMENILEEMSFFNEGPRRAALQQLYNEKYAAWERQISKVG